MSGGLVEDARGIDLAGGEPVGGVGVVGGQEDEGLLPGVGLDLADGVGGLAGVVVDAVAEFGVEEALAVGEVAGQEVGGLVGVDDEGDVAGDVAGGVDGEDTAVAGDLVAVLPGADGGAGGFQQARGEAFGPVLGTAPSRVAGIVLLKAFQCSRVT